MKKVAESNVSQGDVVVWNNEFGSVVGDFRGFIALIAGAEAKVVIMSDGIQMQAPAEEVYVVTELLEDSVVDLMLDEDGIDDVLAYIDQHCYYDGDASELTADELRELIQANGIKQDVIQMAIDAEMVIEHNGHYFLNY